MADKRLSARQQAFLAAYARTGTVVGAAKAAGMARCQHYVWVKDPVYREALQEAEEANFLHFKAELDRRIAASRSG